MGSCTFYSARGGTGGSGSCEPSAPANPPMGEFSPAPRLGGDGSACSRGASPFTHTPDPHLLTGRPEQTPS